MYLSGPVTHRFTAKALKIISYNIFYLIKKVLA